MNIKQLIDIATDKSRFLSISDYIDFCLRYLEFIKDNLQAVIVSRNENHYRFFQYGKDGTYNVTRPINANIMLPYEKVEQERNNILLLIRNIREYESDTRQNRELLNNIIYTVQQSIGAALDALPAKMSNTARKINGDLFERLVMMKQKQSVQSRLPAKTALTKFSLISFSTTVLQIRKHLISPYF